MAQDGILNNWLYSIAEKQRTQYAAVTVKREVYETLGAFYGATYGEDWEMWVRIAKNYPVAYTPDLLATYRMHTTSISGSKFLNGEHLQDLHAIMMLIQSHLPEQKRLPILSRSRKYYAKYGCKVAGKLWKKLHNKQVMQNQIGQILKLDKSPFIYFMVLRLQLKLALANI